MHRAIAAPVARAASVHLLSGAGCAPRLWQADVQVRRRHQLRSRLEESLTKRGPCGLIFGRHPSHRSSLLPVCRRKQGSAMGAAGTGARTERYWTRSRRRLRAVVALPRSRWTRGRFLLSCAAWRPRQRSTRRSARSSVRSRPSRARQAPSSPSSASWASSSRWWMRWRTTDLCGQRWVAAAAD